LSDQIIEEKSMFLSNSHPWPLQNTFKKSFCFQGIGIHTGKDIKATLKPAPENTGIRFVRTDTEKRIEIPASWQHIQESPLCTSLHKDGHHIHTIEHLMAALYGYGIDNAIIELDGPEVPIFDGSASPFLFLMECIGREEQKAYRNFIKIQKEIKIEENASKASFKPFQGLKIDSEIHFEAAVIGRQKREFYFSKSLFKQDIAPARTFGFLKDVDRLHAAGLSKGASLDNVVVINHENDVMNPEGLRFKDEFIRHKILDSIGDLYLGGWILGAFEGYKSSHALHLKLLKTLFEDEKAYTVLKGPTSSNA
jgi:UDP-3-O-[3-hydroxymyristoyl] N-acetylglucosamine deacetylase